LLDLQAYRALAGSVVEPATGSPYPSARQTCRR
jgi:hypothetical protein